MKGVRFLLRKERNGSSGYVVRGKHICKRPGYETDLMERIVENSTKAEFDCWIWTRLYQRNGYGSIRAYGRMMPAHRAAYLAFKGSIPAGMEVGHTCHNRGCVNPDHLEAMTHAENMKQMRERRAGVNANEQ